MSSIGILFGVLAMIGWGLADFLAAICLRKNVKSEKLYFFVQLLGVIPMLIMAVYFFQIPAFSIEIVCILLLAALLTLIEYVYLYKAFDVGPVSLAAPICASYPVLTVIFSVLFLGESLLASQLLPVCLVICGIVLISLDLRKIGKLKMAYSKKGLEFALISVFASGILFTLLGFLIKQIGWFAPIMLMKFLVVIYLFPYLKLKKIGFQIKERIAWILIGMMALLEAGAFLAYSLGTYVLLNSIVVPVSAAYPLVTILLAKIFFKEKIAVSQYVGIAMVILGILALSMF